MCVSRGLAALPSLSPLLLQLLVSLASSRRSSEEGDSSLKRIFLGRGGPGCPRGRTKVPWARWHPAPSQQGVRVSVWRGSVGPCTHPVGPCTHPMGPCTHPLGLCAHPVGPCAHPVGLCAHPVGPCVRPAGPCVRPSAPPRGWAGGPAPHSSAPGAGDTVTGGGAGFPWGGGSPGVLAGGAACVSL